MDFYTGQKIRVNANKLKNIMESQENIIDHVYEIKNNATKIISINNDIAELDEAVVFYFYNIHGETDLAMFKILNVAYLKPGFTIKMDDNLFEL